MVNSVYYLTTVIAINLRLLISFLSPRHI